MRFSGLLAFMLVLGACSKGKKAQPADTRAARDSAARTDGSGGGREAALDLAMSREGLSTLDSAARVKLAADSAVAIVVATQPKSRTYADSFSLAASIRAGL